MKIYCEYCEDIMLIQIQTQMKIQTTSKFLSFSSGNKSAPANIFHTAGLTKVEKLQSQIQIHEQIQIQTQIPIQIQIQIQIQHISRSGR